MLPLSEKMVAMASFSGENAAVGFLCREVVAAFYPDRARVGRHYLPAQELPTGEIRRRFRRKPSPKMDSWRLSETFGGKEAVLICLKCSLR